MFKPFTLEDVYQYAEKMGYTREDVTIGEEIYGTIDVDFGSEYTEVWTWTFETLDGYAIDYDHIVWGD